MSVPTATVIQILFFALAIFLVYEPLCLLGPQLKGGLSRT